ncbi:MAG: hypothetical protein ABDH37_06700 [Candidatus Hydrothermales bacterium]
MINKILLILFITFISCVREITNFLPLGNEFEEIWKNVGEISGDVFYVANSKLNEEVFYISSTSKIYKFKNDLFPILDISYCGQISSSFHYPEKIMFNEISRDSFIFIFNVDENKLKEIKLPFSPSFFSFSPFDSLTFYFIENKILIKSYNLIEFDTIYFFPSRCKNFILTKSGKIFVVTDHEIFYSDNQGISFYPIFSSQMSIIFATVDEEENVYVIFRDKVFKSKDFILWEEVPLSFDGRYVRSITCIKRGFICAYFIDEELKTYKFTQDKFIEFSYGLFYRTDTREIILSGNGSNILMAISYGDGEWDYAEGTLFFYFKDTELPP